MPMHTVGSKFINMEVPLQPQLNFSLSSKFLAFVVWDVGHKADSLLRSIVDAGV